MSNLIYQFQIHHIFPREIFARFANLETLLNRFDFFQEARSNKVGLLVDQTLIDVLKTVPQIVNLLLTSGFGLGKHDGSHPSYTQFLVNRLNQIDMIPDEVLGEEGKRLAIVDLHRFASNVSKGLIPNGDSFLNVNSSFSDISLAWEGSNGRVANINSNADVEALSADQRSTLNTYDSSFNSELTDPNTERNSQQRFDSTNTFVQNGIEQGVFSGDEIQTALDRVNTAEPNVNSRPGDTSSAFISNLYDLTKKFAGDASGSVSTNAALFGLQAIIEKVSADITLAVGVTAGVTFEAIQSSVTSIFTTIQGFGNRLSDSINDFTPEIIETIGRNLNSILVGVGGSVIGDVVEFLNLAYPAIRKGFQEDDWSDLGNVILQFGAAVVFSAILATATISLAAFFAGPVGAAFAAAGFAAYGLFDAVTNGAELLGRIGADIAETIANINLDIEAILDGQENAGGLERLVDAYTLIFAGSRKPEDIAPFDFAYVVDNLVDTLPDAIRGTEESELFFGRNNAVIRGGGGTDEIHHSGHGEAFGEEGNDFLRGENATVVFQGELLDPNAPEPEEGEEDTRERAETDLRLTLDGGVGDDYVIALGGLGAITVGGEGRDFIFNTSEFGQIYGDTLDGLDADGNPLDHTGSDNADTFWFWPGTFIQDAQANDRITLFGIPLVGGSNSIAGIPAGDGSAALDFFSFGTYYTAGSSGQLAITNLFARLFGIGPEGLEATQVVENYDFGGFSDEQYGRAAPGDLGLTFRIFLPLDRALEGVTISLFNAVWGSLFAILDAAEQLAKLNLFFFIPPQASRKYCY